MNTKIRLSMFCVVFAVLTLSSCASNSGDQLTESEDGIELPPAVDGDVALPPVDSKAADVKPEAESQAQVQAALTEVAPIPEVSDAGPVTQAAEQKTEKHQYHVKPGQTLMQIAYDVYGDIYKWKHILEMNEGKIKNPTELSPGLVLSVDQDPKDAVSKTEGTPYLIKQGDSLVIISDDVYGTVNKWKKLWDNNKKLIHDPNRIYAGFYLYYLFNEQDRIEKEQFKGLQKPAMLQASPTVERDVSSVSKQPAAQ